MVFAKIPVTSIMMHPRFQGTLGTLGESRHSPEGQPCSPPTSEAPGGAPSGIKQATGRQRGSQGGRGHSEHMISEQQDTFCYWIDCNCSGHSDWSAAVPLMGPPGWTQGPALEPCVGISILWVPILELFSRCLEHLRLCDCSGQHHRHPRDRVWGKFPAGFSPGSSWLGWAR